MGGCAECYTELMTAAQRVCGFDEEDEITDDDVPF
jgi:hypothetical protein